MNELRDIALMMQTLESCLNRLKRMIIKITKYNTK